MCLPVLGAAIGAVASVAQGAAANSAAKANARALKRQAGIELMAGTFQAGRQRDQQTRILGTQINNFAANGLALEGSPTDVIQSSRAEGELDIQSTLFGANLRASNLNTQAAIERQKGKDAFVGSIIGGVAGLAQGLGKTVIQGF